MSTSCGRRLWTMGMTESPGRWTSRRPVDNARAGSPARARLPGVSDADGMIEVPPAAVYALAARLGDQAGLAGELAGRLGSAPDVGGPLQPALVEFFFCHRTAAHALAGELDWLGSTIAAVVDSWLGLDRGLLGSAGQAVPR